MSTATPRSPWMSRRKPSPARGRVGTAAPRGRGSRPGCRAGTPRRLAAMSGRPPRAPEARAVASRRLGRPALLTRPRDLRTTDVPLGLSVDRPSDFSVDLPSSPATPAGSTDAITATNRRACNAWRSSTVPLLSASTASRVGVGWSVGRGAQDPLNLRPPKVTRGIRGQSAAAAARRLGCSLSRPSASRDRQRSRNGPSAGS
jgi:hypothetical protein